MTAEQFAYWLQGFTELTQSAQPTPEQWKSINDHLKTVFVKVTPSLGDSLSPQPGTVRTSEFRYEDYLKQRGIFPGPFDFGKTVITC
jgi:hypothetical protein